MLLPGILLPLARARQGRALHQAGAGGAARVFSVLRSPLALRLLISLKISLKMCCRSCPRSGAAQSAKSSWRQAANCAHESQSLLVRRLGEVDSAGASIARLVVGSVIAPLFDRIFLASASRTPQNRMTQRVLVDAEGNLHRLRRGSELELAEEHLTTSKGRILRPFTTSKPANVFTTARKDT